MSTTVPATARSALRQAGPAATRRATTALCLLIGAAGLGVAALAILRVPMSPDIALTTGLTGPSTTLGVFVWTTVCLVTTSRGVRPTNHVVIVFSLGPLLAVAALGGPAAVAVVATVGTLELRELRREIPWYGVLANHGTVALAWTVAAFVMAAAVGVLNGAGLIGSVVVVALGAAVGASLNLVLASTLLAVRTGSDPRRALEISARELATLVATEALLAWLLSVAWLIVWWSAFLFIVIDATAAGALENRRTARLLRRDVLTALPNEFAFRERALRIRRSPPAGLAVFYVDLDNLKLVNDTHDHDAGDAVIRATGERLAGACRPGDFLARLHGDEFVLIAAGIGSEAQADAMDRRLTEATRLPVAYDDELFAVSASVGHRLIDDAAAFEAAVVAADRAMARAKQEKRLAG